MLVLRLQRTGRKNVPTYRLVVAEKSAAVKGKSHEQMGYYLPQRHPHVFEFKRERIEHWLQVGAQPSDTVARLLTCAGVPHLEKFIRRYTKQAQKGATEATSATVQPTEDAAKKKKKEAATDDTGMKAE